MCAAAGRTRLGSDRTRQQHAGSVLWQRRIDAGEHRGTEERSPPVSALSLDIRDRQTVRELFKCERPNFIIHPAAQPSHDKAASIPFLTRISMSTQWVR